MKWLRSVISISAQNFRKWQADYRVWCIGVVLIAIMAIFIDELRLVIEVTGTEMPVWVFPFLYSQGTAKLIFTLPVVLLFCGAPFLDRNQTFVFMRTGRVKWLCGQLLYIVIASAVYYLFILAASLLLTAFSGGFSLEWGDTLKMIATSTDLRRMMSYVGLHPSYFVMTFFKPLQAVWFTFLMSWLGGIFIGLTIFACNLISGTKYLGVSVSSYFVLLSYITINEGALVQGMLRFSPISWITLDNIDVGHMTKKPPFTYCVCVFAGLIAVLTAVILIFGRKKSLDVRGDQ